MTAERPTRFPELNALLRDLVESALRILEDDLVGFYLVGSFAVGDADIHSDCDFLAVLRNHLTPDQESSLRKLHDDIPTRPGHWTKHIEGSYAPADELRTLDHLGKEWLYIDHGHRRMEWSTHCNTVEHRSSLRDHGVTLTGPAPRALVDEIDPDTVRATMRLQIQTLLPDLETWIAIDRIAWGQRYAVTTICRMLYSIETGCIASKRTCLRWGADHLDPRWSGLIRHALDGRRLGWDPDDIPDPDTVRETVAFAAYASARAAQTGL